MTNTQRRKVKRTQGGSDHRVAVWNDQNSQLSPCNADEAHHFPSASRQCKTSCWNISPTASAPKQSQNGISLVHMMLCKQHSIVFCQLTCHVCAHVQTQSGQLPKALSEAPLCNSLQPQLQACKPPVLQGLATVQQHHQQLSHAPAG